MSSKLMHHSRIDKIYIFLIRAYLINYRQLFYVLIFEVVNRIEVPVKLYPASRLGVSKSLTFNQVVLGRTYTQKRKPGSWLDLVG